MWDLIVLIHDHCFSIYFSYSTLSRQVNQEKKNEKKNKKKKNIKSSENYDEAKLTNKTINRPIFYFGNFRK